MLIAHCIRALIVVLGLAIVIPVTCNNAYFNESDAFYDFYRHKRSARRQNKQIVHIHEGRAIPNVVEDQYSRVTKKLHQHHVNNNQQHPEGYHQHIEGHHAGLNRTGECCPTVLEKVEPRGGSTQDGMYVELYQDHNYKQRFFELSCHSDVIDKPCNFINRRNHQSKCVQKYSYTYALVKNTDFNRTKHFPMFPVHEQGGATYTLDYIRVRSGCSCEVTLKKKRKKKNTKGHLDDT